MKYLLIIIVLCLINFSYQEKIQHKIAKCGKLYYIPGYNFPGSLINLVTEEPTLYYVSKITCGDKIVRDHWREKTWALPNEMTAIFDGNMEEKTHIFKSVYEYLLYKSTEVGVKLDIPKNIGAIENIDDIENEDEDMKDDESTTWFSMSINIKNVEKIINKNKKIYSSRGQKIRVYRFRLLQSPKSLNITDELKNAINVLPTEFNNSTYRKFILKYGTHYIDQAWAGGEGSIFTEITKDYYRKFGENSVLIDISADFDFLKIHAKYERIKRENKVEWTKNTNVDTKFIGGDASGGIELNKWKKWAPSVAYAPSIIRYTVQPLWNIIKEKQKAINLRKAILYYKKENQPHFGTKNCKHLVESLIPPSNMEKLLIKFYYEPGKLTNLYLVNGPSDKNECIVSYTTSLNGKSTFQELTKPKVEKIRIIGFGMTMIRRSFYKPVYFHVRVQVNGHVFNDIRVDNYINVKINETVNMISCSNIRGQHINCSPHNLVGSYAASYQPN